MEDTLQGWGLSSGVSDLRILFSVCQLSGKDLLVSWEKASLSWGADMVSGTGWVTALFG